MTCDHCGRPSESPTCDTCLGYQAWASGTGPGTKGDQRRQRKLDRAHADLKQLPDLYALLPAPTDKTSSTDGGGGGKISGSPALLRLDVLALVDDRQKEGWHGEDPRYRQVVGRYGVTPTLETWTRVVHEEMPEHEQPALAEHATVSSECGFLLQAWDWITDQQWAEELADDITTLAALVRTSSGVRQEYRPRCRYCRDLVQPVDARREVTTWDACAYGLCRGCGQDYPPGPALAALGRVQEPLLLKQIAETTGIAKRTLERWAAAGAITPAPNSQGKRRGRLFDLAEVRAVATRLHRTVAG